ncbi:MAG: DUF1820 family protein [Acidobacteria bacterium]|nr:MAG: DUF1820 family protein [Acidobacteriota bacterium]REK00154.1 MAG: DUF1820 family protein [Acidobacteriota bacterium]
MPEPQRIYKVIFASQGQIYEIFARQISQGGLFGFVEVEEILFGERSKVVVDPSEERLKHEFDGVRRTYLPMHAILRIDEVEKEGAATIREGKSEMAAAVTTIPFPMIPPKKSGPK